MWSSNNNLHSTGSIGASGWGILGGSGTGAGGRDSKRRRKIYIYIWFSL